MRLRQELPREKVKSNFIGKILCWLTLHDEADIRWAEGVPRSIVGRNYYCRRCNETLGPRRWY